MQGGSDSLTAGGGDGGDDGGGAAATSFSFLRWSASLMRDGICPGLGAAGFEGLGGPFASSARTRIRLFEVVSTSSDSSSSPRLSACAARSMRSARS